MIPSSIPSKTKRPNPKNNSMVITSSTLPTTPIVASPSEQVIFDYRTGENVTAEKETKEPPKSQISAIAHLAHLQQGEQPITRNRRHTWGGLEDAFADSQKGIETYL
jgi:hypothetical protein